MLVPKYMIGSLNTVTLDFYDVLCHTEVLKKQALSQLPPIHELLTYALKTLL